MQYRGQKGKGNRCVPDRCTGGAQELADKELLSIYMPMTHDAKELEENHRKGAKALEEVLGSGKDIVFLTLGDPTIYSTFSYLQKRVEDDGYETALVSGITSFCAAAARTNQPLVEWNQTLHIVPAVHRLGDTPDAEGNYVFMKSGKKMKQVRKRDFAGDWKAGVHGGKLWNGDGTCIPQCG